MANMKEGDYNSANKLEDCKNLKRVDFEVQDKQEVLQVLNSSHMKEVSLECCKNFLKFFKN